MLALALSGSVLLGGPLVWTRSTASGHIYDEARAPSAPTVIVFGAQLRADGRAPRAILAGRLEMAAGLILAGKTQSVLVTGDANGASGDEISVMTSYLVRRGVDPDRIVADPFGLDTYDSCRRARDVYGVTRALLVTQRFHLPRAVTLCRSVGIDADGVPAGCRQCSRATWARNNARDLAAGVKAAVDVIRDRPAAVPALVRSPEPS